MRYIVASKGQAAWATCFRCAPPSSRHCCLFSQCALCGFATQHCQPLHAKPLPTPTTCLLYSNNSVPLSLPHGLTPTNGCASLDCHKRCPATRRLALVSVTPQNPCKLGPNIIGGGSDDALNALPRPLPECYSCEHACLPSAHFKACVADCWCRLWAAATHAAPVTFARLHLLLTLIRCA